MNVIPFANGPRGRGEHEFDIVVAGAGVVGSCVALLAAAAGFKVALLDDQMEPSSGFQPERYDPRVLALNLASVRLFERLGVWPGVLSLRAGRFTRMEVWDPRSIGRIAFDAATTGSSELGFVVEMSVLTTALTARLDHTDVRCFRASRIQALGHSETGLTVDLGSYTLTTRLLVGADGANSPTRSLAGLAWEARDYGEHAVVATLRTTWPHGEVARQAFLATGPLALLPGPESHWVTLVWTQPSERAQERVALSGDRFAREVTEASGGVLGGLTPVGEIKAAALRRGHAPHYVAPRIALVGDAAHVIHPLAGQGANLGFLDAIALVEALILAREQHRDIGLRSTLRVYERQRKPENLLMQGAMDGFRFLFSHHDPLRLWVANLGLAGVARLPGLKDLLLNHALGSGGTPTLTARTPRHRP